MNLMGRFYEKKHFVVRNPESGHSRVQKFQVQH
jgi:hypothetical protein